MFGVATHTHAYTHRAGFQLIRNFHIVDPSVGLCGEKRLDFWLFVNAFSTAMCVAVIPAAVVITNTNSEYYYRNKLLKY